LKEVEFENKLQEELDSIPWIQNALTYEEGGLMTYNKGLVVETSNGASFQVTIVKVR